ncbi:hypothetical protein [Roseivirga sp. 4D4]|uniref:hypothetical protein n=1 Tax=Roseivirga sp. 4D4 TaxID=1889784 RepID=UPI00147D6283|nr:hypothetical protein [Roseivirga sp. 4D4]
MFRLQLNASEDVEFKTVLTSQLANLTDPDPDSDSDDDGGGESGPGTGNGPGRII